MKVPKEEVVLLERIFMLTISKQLLEKGRRPFHNEAIKLIEQQIKKLKQ